MAGFYLPLYQESSPQTLFVGAHSGERHLLSLAPGPQIGNLMRRGRPAFPVSSKFADVKFPVSTAEKSGASFVQPILIHGVESILVWIDQEQLVQQRGQVNAQKCKQRIPKANASAHCSQDSSKLLSKGKVVPRNLRFQNSLQRGEFM